MNPLGARGSSSEDVCNSEFENFHPAQTDKSKYPEVVRRFAVAKILENNCNQYGGNPKIPASCRKSIPGIKNIK